MPCPRGYGTRTVVESPVAEMVNTPIAVSAAYAYALHPEGAAGIERYNALRKVEPMQRALDELQVRTWFSGLRRVQSESRAATPIVELRQGRWKVHPIADWRDRDVHEYLARHDLPYHPLRDQGYLSIGDVHTTQRWEPGMREEDTRVFGLGRECGIHA